MSHSFSPVTINDVERIALAEPAKISTRAKTILWVMIGVGIASFAFGVMGDHPQKAWISLHVNYLYWLYVSVAAAAFAAVFQICNAEWARPINRIFQSGLPYMKWSLLVLVVLYFGKGHLFVWAHEDIPGKADWLSPNFVYIRDFLAILFLYFLCSRVIVHSIRRDLCALRSGVTGISKDKLERWFGKEYNGFIDDAGDSDPEGAIVRSTSAMGYTSPLVIIFYAVIMTLIAFDQLMSVDPHWYSTMFGGFLFMSGVYLAVSWASIGVAFLREIHPIFRAKIERRTLHDLGKLVFGFGIFWAYLFWSHYLPIWYGNIPEETGYIILRLRVEPWHSVAWLVLGTSFIIPFLLGLSRDVKQIPVLLFTTAVIIACGQWLLIYLLFVPSHFPHEVPLNWVDGGVTIGFLGGFLLCAAGFLEKVPLMPFGDFYLDRVESELKEAA